MHAVPLPPLSHKANWPQKQTWDMNESETPWHLCAVKEKHDQSNTERRSKLQSFQTRAHVYLCFHLSALGFFFMIDSRVLRSVKKRHSVSITAQPIKTCYLNNIKILFITTKQQTEYISYEFML